MPLKPSGAAHEACAFGFRANLGRLRACGFAGGMRSLLVRVSFAASERAGHAAAQAFGRRSFGAPFERSGACGNGSSL